VNATLAMRESCNGTDPTYRKKGTTGMKALISSSTGERNPTPGEWKLLILCPITGRPCEGDLAYLCPDYGCARKGGLSPRSEENF
jgi:hypothetical protein